MRGSVDKHMKEKKEKKKQLDVIILISIYNDKDAQLFWERFSKLSQFTLSKHTLRMLVMNINT